MNNLAENILSTSYTESLLQRFLKYVQIYSESDSNAADEGTMPSTQRQFDMAKVLRIELEQLGLENAQTDEHCYTYAILPASPSCENVPPICLIAHIDTVDEVTGKDVKPIVHKDYTGSQLPLPSGIALNPDTDKKLALAGKVSDTIITSDGSTLLGADDKAGIAEIMTALEFLVQHKDIRHGAIEVIFSPDEETGHGMDKVPLTLLKSRQCYTVDGGHEGELETECFNAYKSEIHFTGKAKHPGDARADMVNATLMASAFVASLPRHEMPETTDGYMGYYAPTNIEGGMESAHVSLILRDFDIDGMKKRMSVVDTLANAAAVSFGGTVKVEHAKQYLNMKNGMDKKPKVVQNLIKAYHNAGIEPVFTPIRGGTDGSRLTELGIPTPNIFTGGHNYHSRYEWASLTQMTKATEILIQLAQTWLE